MTENLKNYSYYVQYFGSKALAEKFLIDTGTWYYDEKLGKALQLVRL